MSRRTALTLATLFAATALAVPSAAAADAPAPKSGELTSREQAALQIAEQALGKILGGAVTLGGH
ncbi:hypothetical protein ACFW4X_06320 [Streptomyces smyrnaeus]|uniref:hypothetical protein n=1 Tax=Streptomyces smyrnaeus TaxID=1387713 RepID=UPI003407087C